MILSAHPMLSPVPIALTIAGSDSGGGAGIQADLRTFAFHLVHGTSALTCITAQNTLGVSRVDALEPTAVIAQIDAVVSDIGIQALKTGMLLNGPIIEAVADRLRSITVPIVCDPVMVSRTGAQLIDDDAIAILRRDLLPQSTILTPNRYEAQLLSGVTIDSLDDMKTAADRILNQGVATVLIKCGGMTGALRGVDLLADRQGMIVLQTEFVDTPHSHGTGCTLSAAIAANLARGLALEPAVRGAKIYVTDALKHSLAIGKGQGPVGHFFPLLGLE
jgi:hydroxymethylpyrimidine/phosphomethylpyrimidine kinase